MNRKVKIALLFLVVLSVAIVGAKILFAKTSRIQTAGVLQSEKPPMFVLQVGISKYLHAPDLQGSRFDVDGMKEILTGERYKIPANNIHTLTDAQATKERIIKEFENHLIKNARDYYAKTKRRDAVALFQYSGHGSQVPDTNGDEEDGKDETLVTYDSQDAPGKNFDITDDEIYELTEQLSRYTENIVYILDSCHSGSGTRDAGEARRVPARKTVPAWSYQSLTQTRGGQEKKAEDNRQTDFMPVGDDYIVISAARPEQIALQKNVFADDTSRYPSAVYGNLTFYLMEGLRNAGAETTYRELMREVSRKVSAETSDSQTPQIEGEDRRAIFGGLSKREDNSIEITEIKNKQITIKAGAMQGVTNGTIVDVYDKEKEKIASAKVVKISAGNSVADVIEAKKEISANDRAVIVSIDFGAAKLKVLLDGEDASKLSPADKSIVQTLQNNFAPNEKKSENLRAVEITKGKWNDKTARWDIALLKDRFDKVFPDKRRATPIKIGNSTEKFPSEEKEIFYLAGRDFKPLYGFYVEAENADAAQKIEKALIHLSKLRAVNAIANEKSALAGKIKITPVRLIYPKCENNLIVDDKKENAAFDKIKNSYEFNAKTRFWLEIENQSKKDVYITLLDLGTDGSIKVVFPRKTYEEKDGIKLAAGEKRIILGEKCQDGTLVTTLPAGRETFKVIAAAKKTGRDDFEFLELDSINQRGKQTSLASVGDWTTAEVNFEITTP